MEWHASIKFWILWPSSFVSIRLLYYTYGLCVRRFITFSTISNIVTGEAVFLFLTVVFTNQIHLLFFFSFNLSLQLLNKALFYYILSFIFFFCYTTHRLEETMIHLTKGAHMKYCQIIKISADDNFHTLQSRSPYIFCMQYLLSTYATWYLYILIVLE